MSQTKDTSTRQTQETQDPYLKRLVFLQELAAAVSNRWKIRGRLSGLEPAVKELLAEIKKPVP
jgi:hypothetical protein